MQNAVSETRLASLTLHNFHDMEHFGVRPLTGEACVFSQRILCDVNEDGKALLAEYFGIPEMTLAAPMNTTVQKKPAIGSLMLDRSAWPALARFALFLSGALALYEPGDRVHQAEITGIYTDERLREYERAHVEVRRNPRLGSTQPHVGSRNVHQMTGRVL